MYVCIRPKYYSIVLSITHKIGISVTAPFLIVLTEFYSWID